MQLNDRELIAALTSIILPLLIAWAQRPTWAPRTRALVAFLGIFIWTVLGVIYIGEGVPQSVDWHAWLRLLLVNALVAWTTFQHFWKQVGLSQTIEARTSPESVAQRALAQEAARKARPPREPAP